MYDGLGHMIEVQGRFRSRRTIRLGCPGAVLQNGLYQIGCGIADVYLAAGDIVFSPCQRQRFGETGDGMLGGCVRG